MLSPNSFCEILHNRKKFTATFVELSQEKYDRYLKLYAKTPGSCLTLDAGKHHTRPYLIFVLSNCLHDIPPLVVETERYFKGRAIDYREALTKVCTSLLQNGVKIAGLVTDNLRAQKNSVNHTDQLLLSHTSSLSRRH